MPNDTKFQRENSEKWGFGRIGMPMLLFGRIGIPSNGIKRNYKIEDELEGDVLVGNYPQEFRKKRP